jgi:rubrerythrin
MRYQSWADKARQENLPNVAKLFVAIAAAERVHADNHFVAMNGLKGDFLVSSMAGFGVGSTSDNLAAARAGELFEVHEMYPAYMEIAKAQKESAAIKTFHYAMAAEAVHAQMYATAKQAVDCGKDASFGTIRVCPTCGHTHDGDVLDRCPVCGVAGDKFLSF